MNNISKTGTPQEMYGLQYLGRACVDGTEWVAYSDGCYRHVVAAEDWDRDTWPGDDPEKGIDYYTDQFCCEARFADDATARRVADECDLSGVHSADGTCSPIEVV